MGCVSSGPAPFRLNRVRRLRSRDQVRAATGFAPRARSTCFGNLYSSHWPLNRPRRVRELEVGSRRNPYALVGRDTDCLSGRRVASRLDGAVGRLNGEPPRDGYLGPCSDRGSDVGEKCVDDRIYGGGTLTGVSGDGSHEFSAIQRLVSHVDPTSLLRLTLARDPLWWPIEIDGEENLTDRFDV